MAGSERTKANARFVAAELQRSSQYFDQVEKMPLTEEQRKSVVIDEDNNLVVAAAGSGKTSVIVAKAGWEIRNGYREPAELLLLAYGKDAQKDLQRRIAERLGDDISSKLSISTFHSLGLRIIGDSTGKKPSVSKIAEDRSALERFIKHLITDLMSDPAFRDLIYKWFQGYFARYRSLHQFGNLGQYWNYIRTNGIRSLKGEKVKSFEECEIANFLFLNGINYIYEQPYEYDTATSSHRQYKPDFFLPDHKIYIEHLALKGFGRTPSFINRREYLRSLRWKRDLHERCKTLLVETYSCHKEKGSLTSILEKRLEGLGVTFSPISPDVALAHLNEFGRIDDFTKLVVAFLGHYKGGQSTIQDLLSRCGNHADSERNRAFVDVFTPIFLRYETCLRDSGEIDFDDMILQATSHVQDGSYRCPYGYVMVDEFQDISVGRAKLIAALAATKIGSQLFCVGDDWQSIYRFAGSDVSLMREFPDHFGTSEQTQLTATFRYPSEIADISTRFILRNPAQIPKDVRAEYSLGQPGVVICLPSPEEPNLLYAILRQIGPRNEGDPPTTVFLLGRYNRNRPDDLSRIQDDFPNLDISFFTIHKSKGREADYIILLGMVSDFPGFPNEREDDPILDMVLAKPEDFTNAEERRLLYVAITRARHQAYLITDGSRPSSFVTELIRGPYEVEYFGRTPADDIPCTLCEEGVLHLRKSQHGAFFGCSNYPYCEHTRPACPHCSRGLPVATEDGLVCGFCGQTVERCPREGCNGWLTLKNGKFGDFWGCTNYWSSPSCTFTRKAE